MSPQTCPSCGAEEADETRFCTSCGAEMTKDSQPSNQSDGSTIAAITHILGLLTWVIGPLVVLFVSEDPFVKQNAKNAVMWQLMLAIYMIVSVILVIVLIGIVFIIILGLLDLIFCIMAAVKASEGKTWKYPLTPAV